MIEVLIGTSFENSEASSSVEAGATVRKLQKTVVPICSHGHLTKAALSSGQSSTVVSTPFLCPHNAKLNPTASSSSP